MRLGKETSHHILKERHEQHVQWINETYFESMSLAVDGWGLIDRFLTPETKEVFESLVLSQLVDVVDKKYIQYQIPLLHHRLQEAQKIYDDYKENKIVMPSSTQRTTFNTRANHAAHNHYQNMDYPEDKPFSDDVNRLIMHRLRSAAITAGGGLHSMMMHTAATAGYCYWRLQNMHIMHSQRGHMQSQAVQQPQRIIGFGILDLDTDGTRGRESAGAGTHQHLSHDNASPGRGPESPIIYALDRRGRSSRGSSSSSTGNSSSEDEDER